MTVKCDDCPKDGSTLNDITHMSPNMTRSEPRSTVRIWARQDSSPRELEVVGEYNRRSFDMPWRRGCAHLGAVLFASIAALVHFESIAVTNIHRGLSVLRPQVPLGRFQPFYTISFNQTSKRFWWWEMLQSWHRYRFLLGLRARTS
ncbi:hypothetical protein PMIN03_005405 [Paraphaeosphaeria minitans]